MVDKFVGYNHTSMSGLLYGATSNHCGAVPPAACLCPCSCTCPKGLCSAPALSECPRPISGEIKFLIRCLSTLSSGNPPSVCFLYQLLHFSPFSYSLLGPAVLGVRKSDSDQTYLAVPYQLRPPARLWP